MIKKAVALLTLVVLMASCATQQKITYLQDVQPSTPFDYTQGYDVTLQCGDIISIMVASKSPELAAMFNLPASNLSAGSSSGNELSSYSVSSKGCIDFPVLGQIEVAGLTKEEVIEMIKSELTTKGLVNDPIVTASFMNLRFSILGEVSKPGQYNIERSQTTILEALSQAGDLTIYGKRDRVFLTRNVDNQKVTYQLDLRSQDIYTSPAFYVQQNDMIYVEPNGVRANQSTVSGNTIKSPTFWMSLTSFLITLTALFL